MAYKRRLQLVCSAAVFISIFSTGALAAPPPVTEDAWTTISADPQFSDAVELFKYAGLTQYLQTDQFTAFIPTNAAFDQDPDVLPSLLIGHNRAFPDTTLAVNFVRSHAIYDLHPLSEFAGRTQTLTAISGCPLVIDGRRAGIYTVSWNSVHSEIGTAQLVESPIIATNALIYPVDKVVLSDPQNP